MTIERKLLGTSPSGGAADVAEVFSTHLYKGNGSTQTITNGIDLAGEGGLVWLKQRGGSGSHGLYDTERGASKIISSNATDGQFTGTDMSSFNSNGFTLGVANQSNFNNSNASSVSFTFRKKSGFFDCVTYTGNSATDQTINHNLGSTPAFMLVKRTDATGAWNVYHTSMGNQKYAFLNSSEPVGGPYSNLNWAVTDTTFSADGYIAANNDGATYVAYLFADNSSEDLEDQMIKCGSFTGVSTGAVEVNLGWEPQFVILKNASRAGTDWQMQDTMRGMSNTGYNRLRPNTNSAENVTTSNFVVPTATGFTLNNNGSSNYGQSGDQMIYMAIRAPMMKEPEAATDVFAMDLGTSSVPSWISGFPVDMAINATYATTAHKIVGARLTSGRYLDTTVSSAEASEGNNTFDFMNGWNKDSRPYTYFCWMWKRAKGYMDVVCYSGNSTSGRAIAHSLGVVPEMMWVKTRSDNDGWAVYNKTIGATKFLALNNGDSAVANSSWWNNTEPTSASFAVGNSSATNSSGRTYIAYLFATLDGISKVGSYSGNGTNNHVINCGFTAGARFILIKRSNGAGDWFMYDSVRGITSTSNDGLLYLNNNSAQATEAAATGVDAVRPHASGFQLDSDDTLNHSSLDYIFYAIA